MLDHEDEALRTAEGSRARPGPRNLDARTVRYTVHYVFPGIIIPHVMLRRRRRPPAVLGDGPLAPRPALLCLHSIRAALVSIISSQPFLLLRACASQPPFLRALYSFTVNISAHRFLSFPLECAVLQSPARNFRHVARHGFV